jgi:hypothetical protein
MTKETKKKEELTKIKNQTSENFKGWNTKRK